jgi:Plant transposon protein
LKGQFKNPKDGKLAVISIEAWCDRDLYCWHWISGRAGTNNDITDASSFPLFNDILEGEWDPSFEYELEGEKRQVPYFLVDGIYPRWTIFATPYHYPTNVMERTYTKRQEAVRKDIDDVLEFYRVASSVFALRTSFGNTMRRWMRVGLASCCVI